MNNKTGIVMKMEKNLAYIMTATGEFAKVKIDKRKPLPSIGSEYCGLVSTNTFMKNGILKYAAAACLAFTVLLSGGGAYSYYKPVSTVTVSINPAIELKSNMWNKVIDTKPLNSDGKKILQEISLKNELVDDALVSILNQAKKDNFINENYKEMNKTISVNISGKEIKLSSFESEIKKNALNVKVDINGSTILNGSSEKNKNGFTNNKDENNELNNKPNSQDTKDAINNSKKPTDNSTPSKGNGNSTHNNDINNKQNNNINTAPSNSSKTKNFDDKNSSKNDDSTKHDKGFKDKDNENDRPNNSDNKYHDSQKTDKEKKDK